jgi:hypothetical protein
MVTSYQERNPGHTTHVLTKLQTAAIAVGDHSYELTLIEPDGSYYCYMDGVMPFIDFTSP